MLQAHPPDSFEKTGPDPSLKPQMAGAAGTVLAWDHLPLATRSQDVENAIEHPANRHARPTVGPDRFVGRKNGLDQFPKVIRNLAESVPLRFLSHRGPP